MTEHLLSPPPPTVGENQSSDRVPHSSCLQACIASVSTWNGRPTVAREVDDFFAALFVGWNPNDGCTVQMGKAWFDHVGMQCEIDDGNVSMSTYVRPAIDAGDIVIGEHQCDGYTTPVAVGTSDIRHFRVLWGYDDAYVATMNPWYPRMESTLWSTMYAADTKQHIRVKVAMDRDIRAALASIIVWLRSGGNGAPQDVDVADIVDDIGDIRASYEGMVQNALAKAEVNTTWRAHQWLSQNLTAIQSWGPEIANLKTTVETQRPVISPFVMQTPPPDFTAVIAEIQKTVAALQSLAATLGGVK